PHLRFPPVPREGGADLPARPGTAVARRIVNPVSPEVGRRGRRAETDAAHLTGPARNPRRGPANRRGRGYRPVAREGRPPINPGITDRKLYYIGRLPLV